MQASRLLSMLMLLQTRGRQSAPALARALEVSVRTVYRDIDQLSAAGVPVWGEQGRNGGFQLREGWRTQLTGLTVPEARAIFMAGLPGPAAELGLGEAMATAQLKLLAALPSDWQADAQQVAGRFHLDAIDWFRSAAPPPQLKTVAEAVWLSQRLFMRYESWQGVSDRLVEPLGLVLKAGTWYMAARRADKVRKPAQDDEAAVYRLAAIESLELRHETFQRPTQFDLAAWWAKTAERFEAGVYRDEALLRVTELGLQRLMQFNPRVAEAALQSAEPVDQQGWVQVRVPIESIDHAAREMLRLGPEGEVLQPAALRERLAASAAAMSALYSQALPG